MSNISVKGQLKILLVEDNKDFREILESDLSSAGYEVLSAVDGVSAREALEAEEVDIILCDWKMPVISGLDLLGYVRQRFNTPFVLMTGFSDFIEQSDVYASGAAVFLPKPFHRADLLAALNKALTRDGNS